MMAFLTQVESGHKRVLTVYADKLANGLPTNCNGVTKHVTDEPLIVGETWTEEKCIAVERQAMRVHVQEPLLKCLGHEPPQSVFDALSSHAWNFGVRKTCGSVAAQYVRLRDYVTACNRIARSASGKPVWSSAAGKFIPGLQKRRQKEVAFCLRDLK